MRNKKFRENKKTNILAVTLVGGGGGRECWSGGVLGHVGAGGRGLVYTEQCGGKARTGCVV